MRWIPLVILVYVTLLVQTTVGKILYLPAGSAGEISPDFMAMLAVFVALQCRGGLDAAIAAWIGGIGLDLTTAGGPGNSTVVGPMAMAFVAAAGVVFMLREAVFREHALTQAVMALLFCLIAHPLWVTLQALLAGGADWHTCGWLLARSAGVAVFTAALTPLSHYLLGKCRWLLLTTPPLRRGRNG